MLLSNSRSGKIKERARFPINPLAHRPYEIAWLSPKSH
jgi:hypothetical protein